VVVGTPYIIVFEWRENSAAIAIIPVAHGARNQLTCQAAVAGAAIRAVQLSGTSANEPREHHDYCGANRRDHYLRSIRHDVGDVRYGGWELEKIVSHQCAAKKRADDTYKKIADEPASSKEQSHDPTGYQSGNDHDDERRIRLNLLEHRVPPFPRPRHLSR